MAAARFLISRWWQTRLLCHYLTYAGGRGTVLETQTRFIAKPMEINESFDSSPSQHTRISSRHQKQWDITRRYRHRTKCNYEADDRNPPPHGDVEVAFTRSIYENNLYHMIIHPQQEGRTHVPCIDTTDYRGKYPRRANFRDEHHSKLKKTFSHAANNNVTIVSNPRVWVNLDNQSDRYNNPSWPYYVGKKFTKLRPRSWEIVMIANSTTMGSMIAIFRPCKGLIAINIWSVE